VDYVNPFIGTAAYGHTIPGAAMPFGMVQLSPVTGASRGKASYSYSSEPHGRESENIIGFAHTNLSGTGINTASRYSNILFMPTVGPVQIEPGTEADPDSGYRSRFSHDYEEANAGYYKVLLQDYDITADLTVTERVGIHRYRFPGTDNGNIIIDITRERDRPELHDEAFVEVIGNNQVRGYTTVRDHTIGEPVTWYFFAEFSKPFDGFGTFVGGETADNRRTVRGGFGTGAYINYITAENEEVIVKVGISFTGMEGAEMNLREEADGWDFDRIRRNAENAWNEKLGKIRVSGSTPQNRIKFYTALYHSLMFPRVFSDADGSYYSHFEDRIIKEDDFRFHVDFFLWDTYRTTHPLLNIIEPDRQTELIRSMLATYEQGGLIPTQYFKNLYTQSMIGDHGSTMISDAWVKGIRDFDVEKAFEGMMTNAYVPGTPGRGRMGLDTYKELGYVAAETVRETVSLTLEYGLTDYALARVARDLGRMEEYEYLIGNAYNYRNLYDEETGFYRPRFSDGSWLPVCGSGQTPGIAYNGSDSYYDCWNPWWIGSAPHRHYTESNAWQYLFCPQHDTQGLIELMGGREKFVERLDGMFYASSANEGPAYVGVTGAIGQYVQGNQPSFHMAFLYNYAGAPWKTQERIRGIMETLYRADEWGLPGNGDMGSLSSWLVFSAMGFYPVNPGAPHYAITSPLFERIEINLDDYGAGHVHRDCP
jgi:predicted alpha-1,2-mannosidase